MPASQKTGSPDVFSIYDKDNQDNFDTPSYSFCQLHLCIQEFHRKRITRSCRREGRQLSTNGLLYGGASDKFTYIRAKPYRSSFLDSVNLFKFYEGNRRKDIHFWRHEHGDYGTPEGKLPIRIVDTSIVDIDSTIYGKHISNCPTIYFRLKKPGRTEMIIRMAMMRKDTISLLVNDQGLSVSKNRKVRKGKTKWLGIFPLKN